MTDIETLVRSELDRRHPLLAGDPDWEDALRRADRIPVDRANRVTAGRGRRWRMALALVAAVLALAAASLAVVAPWSGSPDLMEQALAALGNGRYVHAVFESTAVVKLVDLASGRERRAVPFRVEARYDTKTGAYASRASTDGVVFDADLRADPAIESFATGYRAALAHGGAHVVGRATVAGVKATVIRFRIPPDRSGVAGYEDVAVSKATHAPLRITRGTLGCGSGCRSTQMIYRVLSIDSSDARPLLAKPTVAGHGRVSADLRELRRVDARGAGKAFGRTPVWPGPVVGGAPLRSIRLQQLETTFLGSATSSTALGLRLDYRGAGGTVSVEEAAKPEVAYGTPFALLYGVVDGPSPAAGQAVLSCDVLLPRRVVAACSGAGGLPHTTWHAQLRSKGLYVTINSPSRRLVLAAARALRPLP